MTEVIDKKYVKLNDGAEGINALLLKIEYETGKDCLHGKEYERGYYLRCDPCNMSQIKNFCNGSYITITSASNGAKMLLIAAKRKNKKTQQQAIEKALEYENRFIKKVCDMNHLVFKEGA